MIEFLLLAILVVSSFASIFRMMRSTSSGVNRWYDWVAFVLSLMNPVMWVIEGVGVMARIVDHLNRKDSQ